MTEIRMGIFLRSLKSPPQEDVHGRLYTGKSWSESVMDDNNITLDGDKLTIDVDLSDLGIQDEILVFTRVVED